MNPGSLLAVALVSLAAPSPRAGLAAAGPVLVHRPTLSSFEIESGPTSGLGADLGQVGRQPVTVEACRASLGATAVARGVPRAVVDSALTGFVPDSTVLAARRRQPEFVTPIWEYLAFLVDDERIADGRARLAEWDSVLTRVEATFGVDRFSVVAVWGIESDYGRVLGQRPLIRSLGTQACYGERRRFAIDQLIASLQIIAAGDLPAEALLGSWAGAFGQTQFMPTTFLATAVDFDGDGRRDIVGSVPDALASTARFLAKAGWRTNQTWGYEVRVPPGYRGRFGRTAPRPVAAWAKSGIRRVGHDGAGSALTGDGPAALLLPAGRRGPGFLALPNFRAFYAYNAAESYALAIGLLADRLRGGGPLVGRWPTDDRALSRAERREVQELLRTLGYDGGSVDGVLGGRTREALRRFQAAVGLDPDGRAGGRVLDSLRVAARRVGR